MVKMRHTIAILLQNETGALARVASMFSTRGYNIESLSVAPTQDQTISRITLVTEGPDSVIEQITKQLNKLIDVADVLDITLHDHIERELIMIKFKIKEQQRELLENILSDHSAETISDQNGFVIVEAMDDWEANSDFLKSIEALAEIIAVARSGPLALAKEEPIIGV